MMHDDEPILFTVPFEGAVYHMIHRPESDSCPFSILTVDGIRYPPNDTTDDRFWEAVRLTWMDVTVEGVDDAG